MIDNVTPPEPPAKMPGILAGGLGGARKSYSPPPRVLAYGVMAQVLVGKLAPSALLALGEPLSAPHLCARILLVRGFVFPFYRRTAIFAFAFFVHNSKISPWYSAPRLALLCASGS
jgi:hypothetical protein